MNIKNLSEDILTVKKNILFSQKTSWTGINTQDIDWYQNQILNNANFMPRAHAETNPLYKQIIPYVIFIHEKKIFVMQRKSTASEQRLANKLSIGIGGHMRLEDFDQKDIKAWAMREFHEEVSYSLPIELTTVGILNDESNDVGKVHLGIIFIIYAHSNDISIKQEHKTGTLIEFSECLQKFDQFETWSQICLTFLSENQNWLTNK